MARESKIDAIALLKQDHHAVETLFRRVEELGSRGGRRKRRLMDEIIHELSVHTAIEEQIFYPMVRQDIPALERQVLRAIEEHHVLKWTLAELQKLDVESERFDAKLQVLIENVRQHVAEEEQKFFPQVRAGMDIAELRALGEVLAMAKKSAPTRPHPRSPDQPPLNWVSGPLTALMDAGRDALALRLSRRETRS